MQEIAQIRSGARKRREIRIGLEARACCFPWAWPRRRVCLLPELTGLLGLSHRQPFPNCDKQPPVLSLLPCPCSAPPTSQWNGLLIVRSIYLAPLFCTFNHFPLPLEQNLNSLPWPSGVYMMSFNIYLCSSSPSSILPSFPGVHSLHLELNSTLVLWCTLHLPAGAIVPLVWLAPFKCHLFRDAPVPTVLFKVGFQLCYPLGWIFIDWHFAFT